MTKSFDELIPGRGYHGRQIQVATEISAPLHVVRGATLDPSHHVRWDARFSAIRPLAHTGGWEHFEYETRLGLGLRVRGIGASRATSHVSVLRFQASSRASLLSTGAGYWRYEEIPTGVRFSTGFDYDVRFGRLGRAVDALLFRPFFAWATARSFDRLRRWLEDDIPPESWRARLTSRAARTTWGIGSPAP
jgi:hypothetical protein